MKSLPFVISKKAISDLEEIWLYTVTNWSVDQADRYYTLILQEIDQICKNPNIGKSKDFIRAGYRTVKIKSHLIFYRINNSQIEVVRILHERMDIDSRLDD